jgi:hypothetical protein
MDLEDYEFIYCSDCGKELTVNEKCCNLDICDKCKEIKDKDE